MDDRRLVVGSDGLVRHLGVSISDGGGWGRSGSGESLHFQCGLCQNCVDPAGEYVIYLNDNFDDVEQCGAGSHDDGELESLTVR